MAEPLIHTTTRRIVMGEVDVAQIHFTTLMAWVDRSLSEWLAASGHQFTDLLITGPGIPIVDVHMAIEKRIMLDDLITLRTSIGAIGTSSFRSRHLFTRGDEVCARGELVHVCVERASRATVPVPQWVKDLAED
jgi:acyl-CoA thioesterase FadM